MSLEFINVILLALNLLLFIGANLYLKMVAEWYKSTKEYLDTIKKVYEKTNECFEILKHKQNIIESQYDKIYGFWQDFSNEIKNHTKN